MPLGQRRDDYSSTGSGSRTRAAWLEARRHAARPIPHHRTKAEGEGVEPSRRLARLISNQMPSPIGLPFRICRSEAPAEGFEPPIVALTRRRLTNSATPVTIAGGMAGFEPAFSCSRSRRISQAFPHPERFRQSAQRESNPHIRPGEAAGSRYIMGTNLDSSPWTFASLLLWTSNVFLLLSNQSTGWDSNPRRRVTNAESSPLDDQCTLIASRTRGARTLTDLVKSQACCR